MFCQVLGLNIARLLLAIAQVESERGATSENVYQLRDIYFRDCNRILNSRFPHLTSFRPNDKFDRHRSEEAMAVYWAYYGERYHKCTGGYPDFEVLARIHNGGPFGWSKPSTVSYWNRVNEKLQHLTIDDGNEWTNRNLDHFYNVWRIFCRPTNTKTTKTNHK